MARAHRVRQRRRAITTGATLGKGGVVRGRRIQVQLLSTTTGRAALHIGTAASCRLRDRAAAAHASALPGSGRGSRRRGRQSWRRQQRRGEEAAKPFRFQLAPVEPADRPIRQGSDGQALTCETDRTQATARCDEHMVTEATSDVHAQPLPASCPPIYDVGTVRSIRKGERGAPGRTPLALLCSAEPGSAPLGRALLSCAA